MSIIRVSKNKKNPYFIMNNTGINDKNLSFKAKGLLAYLISKPDNWYVNYRDLTANSLNGIKSIRSAIKELIHFGYITLAQFRQDNGKFAYCDYIVYEVPQIPTLNKNKFPPHSPFRHTVKRNALTVTPTNTYYNKILKEQTTALSKSSISKPSAAAVIRSVNQKKIVSDLLNKLKITNHKKIFALFNLTDIFNYSRWILSKNQNLKNPTGFLITAIKEQWLIEEPEPEKPEPKVFDQPCTVCGKFFAYEESEKKYTECWKCRKGEK